MFDDAPSKLVSSNPFARSNSIHFFLLPSFWGIFQFDFYRAFSPNHGVCEPYFRESQPGQLDWNSQMSDGHLSQCQDFFSNDCPNA
jgi:hypothetical protein